MDLLKLTLQAFIVKKNTRMCTARMAKQCSFPSKRKGSFEGSRRLRSS